MGLFVIVLLTALSLYLIVIYNRLVAARDAARNAFTEIDVQLGCRHEQVANLVEIARGYLPHEQTTLEAVIQARNSAVAGLAAAANNPTDPAAVEALAAAENRLSTALGRLFALAGACLDLKANPGMMQLSEALTTTENKVAFARQAYNDRVMGYNNAREVFPNHFVSSTFDLRAMTLLIAPAHPPAASDGTSRRNSVRSH